MAPKGVIGKQCWLDDKNGIFLVNSVTFCCFRSTKASIAVDYCVLVVVNIIYGLCTVATNGEEH